MLHIKRSHLRWFKYLIKMPSGCLLGEVCQACLTGRRDTPEELEEVAGGGRTGHLSCSHNPDKKQKIDDCSILLEFMLTVRNFGFYSFF